MYLHKYNNLFYNNINKGVIIINFFKIMSHKKVDIKLRNISLIILIVSRPLNFAKKKVLNVYTFFYDMIISLFYVINSVP